MSKATSWYIPNATGTEVVGPLSLEEVETKIRNGELRPDSFVFATHMKAHRWHRVFEVHEFQKFLGTAPVAALPRHLGGSKITTERIDFTTIEGEYGKENVYRRYPRIPFETEILVHNHSKLVKGKVFDISEKGTSLLIDDHQLFEKGDEVVVTFRNGRDNLGTFSAPAVVVRVNNDGMSTRYGIFFLRLNPKVRRKIAQHIMRVVSESSVESPEDSAKPESA
jgi:hypothetical protein